MFPILGHAQGRGESRQGAGVLVLLLVGGSFGCLWGQEGKRLGDGKLVWMTENLKAPGAGSYCYGDVVANCERYGRLYTWEAAGRACRARGDGWRLPTDEEWRALSKRYGGVSADSGDRGRAAYVALIAGGTAGFEGVLGGGRDVGGEYARGEAHGFYWTATEDGRETAVYYNFGRGGPGLHRQTGGEKARAFSVRCVRDQGLQ
ncbi:MAG: FISUMP domain-containing protein [Bryobacteraceae bacterium]|nr:FISUMP domain-containing protein [Bryobacteraceae bacterium]